MDDMQPARPSRSRPIRLWTALAAVTLAAAPAISFSAEAPLREVTALIEIPAHSFVKYERDPATGRIFVDRFLSTPMVYPANYGAIPDSRADDGDPLDVLVYTRAPILPGAAIRVRAIGVLRMTDGGAGDDKIIAVPASTVDPTYDAIRDIGDLPAAERQRLILFFRTYKLLPEGGGAVEVGPLEGAGAAARMIDRAMQAGTAR